MRVTVPPRNRDERKQGSFQGVTPEHQHRPVRARDPESPEREELPARQTLVPCSDRWTGDVSKRPALEPEEDLVLIPGSNDRLSAPQWPNMSHRGDKSPNVRAVMMTEKDDGQTAWLVSSPL